ncbi:tubulin alpha-3 chain [Stylonychia lemnae]|uniref:Tubulin alpha-3 chain n=1 Tax=Stylonychia lemnae TaxID=5949 RepID=A0A078AJK8_STYLE|nr:tubulin alpha-3 chain [Stylonychia lemnae]|eukprot:CDW82550.1 tubulin alpha-3 chain [Stylonychia lemnae]
MQYLVELNTIAGNYFKNEFDGTILYFSPCGGTGSGVSGVILDMLGIIAPKQKSIGFQLFPSENFSNMVVEPYNFVFSGCQMVTKLDFNIFVTNENALQILKSYRGIEAPKHEEDNKSQSFQTTDYAQKQLINSNEYSLGYYNVKADPSIPNFSFDITTFTRGSANKYGIIREYLGLYQNVKQSKYFGPKLADQRIFSHYFSDHSEKFNMSTLCTSSNIITVLRKNCDKFDKLYPKRAYYHYYVGEGMETGEAAENREIIEMVIKDYEDLSYTQRDQ